MSDVVHEGCNNMGRFRMGQDTVRWPVVVKKVRCVVYCKMKRV